MNFNSKETYLAARKEWKVTYAQLSADIRAARSVFKEAQRKMSRTYYGDQPNSIQRIARINAIHALCQKLKDLQVLRRQANEMLTELSAAKEEARLQWEASKNAGWS